MTCHLSPHQKHSRLYNVTRLLYILGQSLTFFSIVLMKTFAVKTSTFLSVFHCYVIAQNLPSPTAHVLQDGGSYIIHLRLTGLCKMLVACWLFTTALRTLVPRVSQAATPVTSSYIRAMGDEGSQRYI